MIPGKLWNLNVTWEHNGQLNEFTIAQMEYDNINATLFPKYEGSNFKLASVSDFKTRTGTSFSKLSHCAKREDIWTTTALTLHPFLISKLGLHFIN